MDAKLAHLLSLPETPYWAKDLIRVTADKDPVDVCNVLEVIVAEYQRIVEDEIMAGS